MLVFNMLKKLLSSCFILRHGAELLRWHESGNQNSLIGTPLGHPNQKPVLDNGLHIPDLVALSRVYLYIDLISQITNFQE